MHVINPQGHLTLPLVTSAKLNFAQWNKAGQPGGDLEIYGLLNELNRLPGVATTFSCEGHPTKKQLGDFYVACLCHGNGSYFLRDVVDRYMVKHGRSPLEGWDGVLELTHTWASRFADIHCTGVWYSVERLSAAVSKKTKLQFIWDLQQIVKEVADEARLLPV